MIYKYDTSSLWIHLSFENLISLADFQEMAMAPDDSNIVDLARASVSFSMVRHPFERLVSAYKDKVSPTVIVINTSF